MTTKISAALSGSYEIGRSHVARIAALVVALIALPFVVPYVELGTEIVIYAMVLVGLDLVVGYTGLVSFGHAAYFGGGAYAAAIFTTDVLGTGALLPTLAVAIVVVAILGIVFGYLSLRRTGVYFAMLTLATAELLYFIVKQLKTITGGTDGLTGVPTPELAVLRPIFGDAVLLEGLRLYAVVASLLFVGILVARRIAASPFGLTLMTIRENEERAKFLGYNTERYKLFTFVLSSMYAGVAGACLALMNGAVSLSLLNWTLSGDLLIMLILGGLGTVFGPAAGAFVVLLMQEALSAQYAQTYQLYTGLVFIFFVLFLPKGLWNLNRKTLTLGRKRLERLIQRVR